MFQLLFSFFYNFILSSLIHLIYSDSDECEISFYSNITYPKTESLSNGYKLMISAEGIYTFIPSLARGIYSYNFTEEQKIATSQQNEIYQSQICQFSNENGGDEYVLCYVRNEIYVLDKSGKMIFFEKLNNTISSTNSVSLVCNKYDRDTKKYIFFIIINSLIVSRSKLIINGYDLFFIDKNQGKITLFHNNTHSPTLDFDGYYLNFGGISCKIMRKDSSNLMVCFIPVIIQNNQQVLCSLIFDSESFEISKAVTYKFDQVRHISSSVGDDKSKALVCFLNITGISICYSYDINQQKFSENKIVEMTCKLDQTLMKTFYFSDSNEFIISCIDSVPEYNMKRIDHNFNLVQEDYFEKTRFNCDIFYSFSVVYVNKYKDYILIIYSRCNNYVSGIRFFELSNKCDIGNIKGIDDWEEEKETNILSQKQFNSELLSNSSYTLSELINEEKISEKCLCNEDFPYLLFPSQKCTNICSVEQLLDQTCKIDCISEEKFKSLIQNVETLIKNDNFEDDKEIVIVGNNIICDITTTKIELNIIIYHILILMNAKQD